jgi:hypothetical protein
MPEADVKKESRKGSSLNVRLTPVEGSDQPVLANFTRISGAPGIVFVDFGFLEPAALDALTRLARSGGKIPETLTGKLAVRVALGCDTLTTLHRQLGQVIGGLQNKSGAKPAEIAGDGKPAKKEVKH